MARKSRFQKEKAEAVPYTIDGVVGDALAAYVAEGLVKPNFKPAGDDDTSRRSSIESEAMRTWMRRPEVKRVIGDVQPDGSFMSPDQVRAAFEHRYLSSFAVMMQAPDRFLPLPRESRALPRGDAYEDDLPQPELALEDECPPAEM